VPWSVSVEAEGLATVGRNGNRRIGSAPGRAVREPLVVRGQAGGRSMPESESRTSHKAKVIASPSTTATQNAVVG